MLSTVISFFVVILKLDLVLDFLELAGSITSIYTTSYISSAVEPIPEVAFAVLNSPSIYFLRL